MTQPHFVYGTLRPGELAYHQIRDHVARIEPAALQDHRLYVRDGLPFATSEPGHSVTGELLYPVDGQLADKIAAYEGNKLYSCRSLAIRTESAPTDAVVYVGRSVSKGHAAALDRPWSSAGDPLITDGLRVLGAMAAEHLADPGRAAVPADMPGFWERFLPLQGIYLSIASVLERYTALAMGSTAKPMERVESLDLEADAQRAALAARPPGIDVVRSDQLGSALTAPGSKP